MISGELGASAMFGMGGCPGHPYRIDVKRFWECATRQARGCLAGEQLCSNRPRGLGSRQAECQPAAGNKKGQQHPRLY